MNDRPKFTKWSRKTGGVKVCRQCGHRHPPVMRIEGKAARVKTCVKCGSDLPSTLTYPKRSTVKWYVREFDPSTGGTKDHACRSSEAADEYIRQHERDFTRDPVQERLIEHASNLIRQIEADSFDNAVNTLIEKLGGDARQRSLKPVEWDEARRIICDELKLKGRSESYLADIRRVTDMFRAATKVERWTNVTLDTVSEYRRIRFAGGWDWNGRKVKAVQGRAINKDLATLSAFLSRAVRKQWITVNVLENAPDERVKVKAVRVEYMPDEDLKSLIDSAGETWMGTIIAIAYYTGARRGDLLRLEWNDVDVDGSRATAEGRLGPSIYVQGNKADTPHWMPLHPAAVEALETLRSSPVVDRKLFPVRGSRNPASRVSQLFAELCVEAGITKAVERDGESIVKNRWTLHDLRRKANTDLRNAGASPKEREALLGHRTSTVNEMYYEAVQPARERSLIDSLPAFGKVG